MAKLIAESLIKKYWNNRAEEFSTSPSATTNDVCLRELEVAAIAKSIRKLGIPVGSSILDVGCGDGISTLRIAGKFPEFNFTGMDYCDKMICNACTNLATNYTHIDNVSFSVGSVLELRDTKRYNVVLSSRCLINLTSLSDQQVALNNIASCLVDDGTYIGIENFLAENYNLDNLRFIFGLKGIPIRWHNLFFDESVFLNSIQDMFYNVEFNDFLSSYYIFTRVIYSKICSMLKKDPDYLHWMHKIGMLLPSIGKFCPIRLFTASRRGR